MSSRYQDPRDDRHRDRDRDRDNRPIAGGSSSHRDRGDRHDRDRDEEDDDRRPSKRQRERSGSVDATRRSRGDKERSRSRSRSRDRYREKERDRDRGGEKEKKDKKKRHRSRSPSPHTLKKQERRALKASNRREAELAAARQVAEISMYTAEDNPFGDSNLGQQFKWVKKREMEKKKGITDEEAARRDQVRRLEAKEELERLNKRRAEREVEMQLREEEEARLARLAESAQMAEWVAKEDDFQLEQSRRRAGIRMRENRAKAIDFLAINLRFADPLGGASRSSLTGPGEEDVWGWEDAGLEWDIDEPWLIFDNLTLEDTEELSTDIKMYLSLEKAPVNIEFWECMEKICHDRIRQKHLERDPSMNAAQGRSSNMAVEADIARLLEGKTHDQLVALEGNVRMKLARASKEPIDVDYWEGLLRSLEVWKAKSKLHQIHLVVMQNRLEQLRQRQREQALKVQEELGGKLAGGAAATDDLDDAAAAARQAAEMAAEEMDLGDDVDGSDEVVEPYDRAMSPELIEGNKLAYEDRTLPIVDEEESLRAMYAARRLVTSTTFIPRTQRATAVQETVNAPSFADLAAERLYREEAAKNLDEDEEFFNLDEGLFNPGTYSWEDKFRARKPRFFNRVHTGFEWNKYNQTHYDSDNPPPKVVQGYKFNIFYPDLIDKTQTPSYRFVRDKADPDTCLLVFTAGPPYEDIAFKIVDKEWEYSHKRGFRSSFDRGVLQLYFNFKRQFYRK